MEFLESLKPFVELLIGSQGKAAQFVAVLLFIQSVNKVLQVVIPAVKAIVMATPTDVDNKFVGKIESSKIVMYLKWFIDFLFRIKLK